MRLTVLSAALLFAATALTLILLRPLMPIDETRYVAAAWEMFDGGSALVPHLNGDLYAHKPPLLFWLINLVWLAGGVTQLGARLVAPAFSVAAVVLTGVIARALWPDQQWRAGTAALMLAVSPAFLLFGSTTMFDSMLAVATLLAMASIWRAVRQPGRGPWLALGAAIALGVYAKGPVILIHVLPVALTMPLWADRATRPSLRRWYGGVVLSVAVALALVALWLVPALILGGNAYRTEVLWRQSAGRMVSSFAHQRPAWFFLAMLPVFLWPFGWRLAGLRMFAPRRLLASSASRMLVVWIMGALIAFSLISGKQTHYLLPELPAIALLLSGMPDFARARPRDLWLALPVLGIAALILAVWLGQVPALTRVGFQQPALPALLGLAVTAAGIAGFLRLRSGLIGMAALPLSLMLGLHFAAQPLLSERYDVARIAKVIAPYAEGGIAITEGHYHAQFTFAARLHDPVSEVPTAAQIADWAARHPGGVLLDLEREALPGLRPVARLPYRDKTYTLSVPQEANP